MKSQGVINRSARIEERPGLEIEKTKKSLKAEDKALVAKRGWVEHWDQRDSFMEVESTSKT